MKIKFNSPIVLSFVILSFISLILGYITNEMTTILLFSTYESSLLNPLTYIRQFTHVLGHVDFEHYMNNMLYILLLGPLLEEKYGSKLLFWMIMITAYFTAFFNNLFSDDMLLGASGIVFMFIMLSSLTSFNDKEVPLTFILVLILYLGEEVLNGLFSADDISQLAHIVGGIFGAIFGFIIKKIQLKHS